MAASVLTAMCNGMCFRDLTMCEVWTAVIYFPLAYGSGRNADYSGVPLRYGTGDDCPRANGYIVRYRYISDDGSADTDVDVVSQSGCGKILG